MSEPWVPDIDPRAGRYATPVPIASAVGIAQEVVDEWSWDDDAHGYCHERPILIALLAEVASLTAERDRLLTQRNGWQEEARRYAGNADYWRAKAEATGTALERQRPVIEAARAWRASYAPFRGALIQDTTALILAVDALDALDGAPGEATP